MATSTTNISYQYFSTRVRRHCVMLISILVTPRVSALAGCDMYYTNISQQEFGNSQHQSQAETQQEEEDETIPTLSSKKPGLRGKRVKNGDKKS
nr:hypothetical protein [Tanacetum cinerariifolium]